MQLRLPVTIISRAPIFEEEDEKHCSIDPEQTMFQCRYSLFIASIRIMLG
ncbi:MAG: hypothetical protein P1U77_23020 [Rubripirellula sp.]|nr:hypothetical protein [Rubripirellula sp.]